MNSIFVEFLIVTTVVTCALTHPLIFPETEPITNAIKPNEATSTVNTVDQSSVESNEYPETTEESLSKETSVEILPEKVAVEDRKKLQLHEHIPEQRKREAEEVTTVLIQTTATKKASTVEGSEESDESPGTTAEPVGSAINDSECGCALASSENSKPQETSQERNKRDAEENEVPTCSCNLTSESNPSTESNESASGSQADSEEEEVEKASEEHRSKRHVIGEYDACDCIVDSESSESQEPMESLLDSYGMNFPVFRRGKRQTEKSPCHCKTSKTKN